MTTNINFSNSQSVRVCLKALVLIFGLSIHQSVLAAIDSYCIPYNSSDWQASELTLDNLISHGQYPLALQLFGDSASPNWKSDLKHADMLLTKALLHFRRMCPSYNPPNLNRLNYHMQLAEVIENSPTSDDLPVLLELWLESNNVNWGSLSHSVADYTDFLVGDKTFTAVKTVLLISSPHAFSPQTSSIIQKRLRDAGIELKQISPDIAAHGAGDAILESGADLVITDGFNEQLSLFHDHVFGLGKQFGNAGFSLDYELEIDSLTQQIIAADRRFAVLGFSTDKDFINMQVEHSGPPFTYFRVQSHDAAAATIQQALEAGFSSFLVIGNSSETIYLNNLLRLQQPAASKQETLEVVITSKSTWDMQTPHIDLQDLANTSIYDSAELVLSGEGLSQSARVAALFLDIIRYYELHSAGVTYSDFRFPGMTGNYRIVDGQVTRELSLIKLAERP